MTPVTTIVGYSMTPGSRIVHQNSLFGVLHPVFGRFTHVLHLDARQAQLISRLDVRTNQPAVVIYTADYLDIPRKHIHGGPTKRYSKWSAVAIEPQSHVDAINNPEWGVDQICMCLSSRPVAGVLICLRYDTADGPEKDYEWEAVYNFSVSP